MTSPMLRGRYLSRDYWGVKACGAASHTTTDDLSMRCWILRTGAPWRDLPPSYGDWKNTHRRFCRWRDNGAWEALLEQLIDEPDYEWLMIDASHIKVHPHAAGARGGNQAMSLTKGGSTPSYIWPWMRLVCRSESLLRRVPPQIARRLRN